VWTGLMWLRIRTCGVVMGTRCDGNAVVDLRVTQDAENILDS